MEKIDRINQVVKEYFDKNTSVSEIPAKDLMPYFVKAGVFVQDHRNGLPLRNLLRSLDAKNQLHLIPFVFADRKAKNVNWYFRRNNSAQFSPPKEAVAPFVKSKSPSKQSDSDENYVLDLCDEVLNRKGSRQHRFDFLVGDAGHKLPVDIYYSDLNLVIEYREYQHTNEVTFFDKPNVMTVSGVSRGEQRKLYDQRRRDVLPKHGIQLIEIDYSDFNFDGRKRILKDEEKDLEVVKGLVEKLINN